MRLVGISSVLAGRTVTHRTGERAMMTDEQAEVKVLEYLERVVSAFERFVVAVESMAETMKYDIVREEQKGQ